MMQPEELATAQPENLKSDDANSDPAKSESASPYSEETLQSLFDAIEGHVGPVDFEHWFDGKTAISVNGDQLLIGVASPFILSWMQKRFRGPMSAAARDILGVSATAEFHVDSQIAASAVKKNLPQTSLDSSSTNGPQSGGSTGRGQADVNLPTRTDSVTQRTRRYASLEGYIPGQNNVLPIMAIKQVCESPGLRVNPLFLYGGVGNGKSHLLDGIYLETRRQFPALRPLLLGAESFANYFTKALREHSLPAFRQRFRGVDMLLVDDIDFLDGKKGIQEEFLHTIQHLEEHGRQIVLTCDRHPRLLTRTNEELTTRFASGLVCRVETPDFDGRLELARRKMEHLKAQVSRETLTYVARRFKNNVRELEGALNCLATHYVMLQQPIGLSAARKMLSDLERDCYRMVNLADVDKTITTFFGLLPDDLKSDRRQRTISQPRMLAMFLARKYTKAAYSEIGRYFGGRNHSTVMSAERKVGDWLNDNAEISVTRQTWSTCELLETLEQQLVAS